MDKKKRGPYTYEGKDCIHCLRPLTKDNTRPSDIQQANYLCISCTKAKGKRRYFERKELIREQQREYDLENKRKVIEAYGSMCTCCGETILEFLTIDHTHNDGAEDRKKNGKKTGGKLYRWLIQNNFPKDKYQLLCFNCNCAKGFFGYCPHKKPEVIIRVTRKKINPSLGSERETHQY